MLLEKNFERLTISTDYESRREEITKQLVEGAETAGFLTLVDHGITIEEIESQFAISKSFFDLPPEIKGKTPHQRETNNGWEYKVRTLITANVDEPTILKYIIRPNSGKAQEHTTKRSPSGYRDTPNGLAMKTSLDSARPQRHLWLNAP